ncbi:MAG: hypothetical protein KAR31_01545, partial [Candidatus Omnitrophica bacterium]|nr:hypothetical protein [Candidatus Omnitrophota bacterium]
GSIADLSCFDSQLIAEKVAGCPLPVLSGIGHEINISITDMAAHTYAKTPTAIAQFLVNRVQVFLDDLEEKMEQIAEGAQEKIEEEQQKLKSYAISLQNSTRSYLKDHNERIVRWQEVIKQKAALVLKDHSRSLADREGAVKRLTKAYLNSNRVKLVSYERMIDNFHPGNTIKRGFSITRTKDGKAVKNVSSVHLEEELITEVSDGQITSEIGYIKKT